MIITHIQRVTQSIANEIEAGHCNGDRDARYDGQPWRSRQILLRAVQHVAPAWQWRLDSIAEEADLGFEQDSARHSGGGGHNDRTHDIGQNLAKHNVAAA